MIEVDYSKLQETEVDIIKEIQSADFIRQAEIDQELHDILLENDKTLSEKNIVFQTEDKKVKQKFISILKNEFVTYEELNNTIKLIKRDRDIHRRWLSVPPTQYGSHAWHKFFIDMYDTWIDKMREIRENRIRKKYH